MSVDADGPFLTDRVCSNTTLCKLGVPSKEFSIPKGFGDFKGGKIRQKVESKSMAKNEHLRSVFDWIQIQFDKTEFSPKEIRSYATWPIKSSLQQALARLSEVR